MAHKTSRDSGAWPRAFAACRMEGVPIDDDSVTEGLPQEERNELALNLLSLCLREVFGKCDNKQYDSAFSLALLFYRVVALSSLLVTHRRVSARAN